MDVYDASPTIHYKMYDSADGEVCDADGYAEMSDLATEYTSGNTIGIITLPTNTKALCFNVVVGSDTTYIYLPIRYLAMQLIMTLITTT